MAAPFEKASGQPTDSYNFEPLTVAGSAVGFTTSIIDPSDGTPAISAHASIEGGQVRYRADGTDPTTSVGTLRGDGDELVVWGTQDIRSIRFIAVAGDVTVNTHFAR